MPQKDALVCNGARLSFTELDQRSSKLAAALAAQGVTLGERVALCLPNCVEFVIAFIAIVKAGAIAVPIGTRLAAPEMAHILADCKPRAAFIHSETRGEFLQACVPVATLISIGEAASGELDLDGMIAKHEPRSFQIPVEFDDCMICYTSGTTGRPKGAVLTQANFFIPHGYVNAVEWGLRESDRQLITTPLSHRTAFGRVVNMICLGTTLVILPKFDPRETARLCAEESITVLGMVPTVGRMLLHEIETDPKRFATLRIMVATGEAFPPEVKARILRALPHVGIQSYFAMTECGGLTNLRPADQLVRTDSIGRLIPGVEVRFVNAEGRDMPPGQVGELWIRSGEPGRFLTMRGYYGKPNETAEVLRDGWFASGDMARIDADGYLYIVDRKKDMVLTGGYNVYSKEVENVIAEYQGVQDVAVVGVPDPVYGEAVAAFVELKPGVTPITEQDIVSYCRKRIAGYKKPKHVRFLASLPRTSTGKVLKYKLRQDFADQEVE